VTEPIQEKWIIVQWDAEAICLFPVIVADVCTIVRERHVAL
jgi:hypothetical protein